MITRTGTLFPYTTLFRSWVRPKTQQTYAQLLSMARDGGSGIVYCLSRKRVDEIAAKLGADGIRVAPYHAGLDAETRRDNQERFIRDDAQVIVARSAERRVGKEGVRTCRSRWWPYP